MKKTLIKYSEGTPQLPLGTLSMLPNDLLAFIARFLSDYEIAGLGTVSKTFRTWLRQTMRYDPFSAPTATSWKDLGYSSPLNSIADKDLVSLAEKAYAEILKTLKKELGGSNIGKPLEAVVNVSEARGLIGTNCLAQLTLGTKSLVAVNFVVGKQHNENFKMAATDLKSDRSSVNYELVTHRHGEMRLIIKLTDPKDASLNVDKLCCVFCAAQIYALGFEKLITGWRSGKLAWYNFSPIVMFFPKRREKIWGNEVEKDFNKLGSDKKRQFLRLLVEQTNLTELVEQTTPTEKRKAEADRCPHCRAELVERSKKKGSLTEKFLACPNYVLKRCSGFTKPLPGTRR